MKSQATSEGRGVRETQGRAHTATRTLTTYPSAAGSGPGIGFLRI